MDPVTLKNDDSMFGFSADRDGELCDLVTRIHCGYLDFCGCGNNIACLRFIRDGLIFIKYGIEGQPEKEAEHEKWHKEYKDREMAMFGSGGGAYFFYYWASQQDLTEHGGSVPGWLTDKGKRLIELIDLALEEDEHGQ